MAADGVSAKDSRALTLLVGLLGGHGLIAIPSGEHSLQIADLWKIIDHDVGMVRVLDQEILVIGLRWIKGRQPLHPRDDGAAKHFGAIELGNIGLGDSSLRVVNIEDVRPVLRTGIGALPIELCGIVSHREIDLQNLPYDSSCGSNRISTDSA